MTAAEVEDELAVIEAASAAALADLPAVATENPSAEHLLEEGSEEP